MCRAGAAQPSLGQVIAMTQDPGMASKQQQLQSYRCNALWHVDPKQEVTTATRVSWGAAIAQAPGMKHRRKSQVVLPAGFGTMVMRVGVFIARTAKVLGSESCSASALLCPVIKFPCGDHS